MMNKFKNLAVAVLLTSISFSYAQVRIVNSATNSAVNNSSSFIDASSNSTTNATSNVGKGLIFPRTDLSGFTAFSGSPIGLGTSFPTRFDGMIVYNTNVGGVAGVGATDGTLTQGFWYYDNKTTNVAGGTWRALGVSPKVNYLNNTEVVTNNIFNNQPVYAYKGTFIADGISTAVSIPSPTGMTGMTGITIYKAGTTTAFARELYSYTLGTGPGNAITGSTNISVVYPAGTYDYILEYQK